MANEMTVAKDMVVGMKYSLKNDEGVVLDSTDGREAMPIPKVSGSSIASLGIS